MQGRHEHSPHMEELLARATGALRAGRPGDAVPALRELADLRPGNAVILHDLGLACLDSGQIAESVRALRAAITADPGFADAHLRLGIALEAAGDVKAAHDAYRMAWTVRPGLADARYRAGNLLETLGRTGEAADAFRAAAAAAQGTTLGRIAAARALLAVGEDAAAERNLRAALAAEPDNAAALELLGNILADAGRFEAARSTLIRAVERDGRRAGAYYDIARCGTMAPDDPLLPRMRAAATQPGLEPAQRSRVHLALGKAAADTGCFEAAMRHFDSAETSRRQIRRFDLVAFEARVDRMIARFPPDAAQPPPAASGGIAPILILGLPRSGTTLVEQILSSHPDVRAGGELPFWIEHGPAWEAAGMPGRGEHVERDAADYRALLDTLGGARRVTDKMPLNLYWAGLIHVAVPDAVMVHCARAPIDTALSIHRTHFNPRMDFPTGGADLVGTVRASRRLAAHWRRVLPIDRFIEVEYERLVSDPEPAIRDLVAACGLDWNAGCLRPERNARVIRTPSKWQARQPIHRGAVGGWRDYAPWLGELGALLDDTVPASEGTCRA